ncbi:hypothetical protein COE65_24930 [Bacillus sp. AFS051223]|uniref:DUF5677 domain-containing protein n=1 Tax=Bacillus sp. AFS051223 TaxID=2034280 RepID=UPI000BFE025A|nr:DUF5677 domain-containing protein [Bacillus sp. AFS051223]PHA06677.1 hypothetical protein COE65_24930 [Bacillus sp. AFS051223]
MDSAKIFENALKELELNTHFRNIDNRINGVFYTLYARCTRLYFAMDLLKKNSNKFVNHIEILPLLRVFIEGYFHISYIMSEKDLDKVKDAYDNLTMHSGKMVAGKLQHAENLGEPGEKYIEMFDLGYKLPKEYSFFDDIGKLADKSGKRNLYRKYYSVLNSFIHFNPSTYINYGDFREGEFTFNIENNKDRDYFLDVVDMFMYMFIMDIACFFKDKALLVNLGLILHDYVQYVKAPNN